MADTLRGQISELIRRKTPQHLIAAVEQSVKESLVLTTAKQHEDRMAVGTSKLGGRPDLPSEIRWPDWNGKPLSFIAQINLSDLPSLECLIVLPKDGILSFFYSAEQETWGFDPNDKGSWRILHFGGKNLDRRPFPPDLPKMGMYNACRFGFQAAYTLPNCESPHIDLEYGRDRSEGIDQYMDLLASFDRLAGGRPSCTHRFFGRPDQIQGDMLLEAQLASHGLYCGDPSGYQDPRRKDLEPAAIDWQLLLQIDSDDNAGMMWGDMGRIYYLMTLEHLKNKEFDAAWMTLQCT
ncbi:MAG: YwqG family protein [Anaerolineales bacterium]